MQEKEEIKQESKEDYYENLLEKQELRSLNLPHLYIDGLPQNPLLQHSLDTGRDYEKNNKYQDAINEYNACLAHPKATPSNKVASNVLIGNCYYALSKLDLAEEHYKEALKISKEVKDKQEMLRGKSAALDNIGLIHSDKGDLDEALKCHKDALEILEKYNLIYGRDMIKNEISMIHNKSKNE